MMKLMLGAATMAVALTAALSGASAATFNLDTLPTGASGTYASYQPTQDYSALGLGTIASAQGDLNQTVDGLTLSLRTADYVYDPANPDAAQTRIGVENESSNFGYLGVPSTVQVAIQANTFTTAAPGAIFADFSSAISDFSVSAFTFTTNPGFTFSLTAYSGLNGTGDVLGTVSGAVDAGTRYRASTLSLSGLNGALSVGLLGSSGLAHYDGITATQAAAVAPGGVPEPASWAMMLSGFGLVGGALRRRAGRGTVARAI